MLEIKTELPIGLAHDVRIFGTNLGVSIEIYAVIGKIIWKFLREYETRDERAEYERTLRTRIRPLAHIQAPCRYINYRLTIRKRESKVVRNRGTVTTCSSRGISRSLGRLRRHALVAAKREAEALGPARRSSSSPRSPSHPPSCLRGRGEKSQGLLTLATRLPKICRGATVSLRAAFAGLSRKLQAVPLSNYSIARIYPSELSSRPIERTVHSVSTKVVKLSTHGRTDASES